MQKLSFTLGSIVITVVMLSVLAALAGYVERSRSEQSDVSVFKGDQQLIHLSQSELVDQLASVPRDLGLSRVIWSDNGKLSIDIKVASSVHNQSLLYQEVFRWLQFCFRETDNTERLQLRIVIEDQMVKKKYVLLALDANRAVVSQEVLHELKGGTEALSKSTEAALRITYTPLWHQIFARHARSHDGPKLLSDSM
ncbi:hypothetical protein [Paenibacillus marinisediminis]